MTILATLLLLLAGGAPEADRLFAAAARAEGPAYRIARNRLIALGDDAVAALEEAAKSGDGRSRWLAECLLARAKAPDEMTRLEREYAAALGRLWRSPRDLRSHLDRRGESAFFGHPLRFAHEPVVETFEERGVSGMNEWRATLGLPASPLWPALLGEVLLKGWPGEPDPGFGAPRKGTWSRLRLARDDSTRFVDVYRMQALVKLSQLGEARSVRAARSYLRDPKLMSPQRVAAARALVRLVGDRAVPDLVSAVSGGKAPITLQAKGIYMLGRIGTERARRALKGLAAAPGKGPNSEDLKLMVGIALQTWKRVQGFPRSIPVKGWSAFPGQQAPKEFRLPVGASDRGFAVRLTLLVEVPTGDDRLFRITIRDGRNETAVRVDLLPYVFRGIATPRVISVPLPSSASEVRLRWEGGCGFRCEKVEIVVEEG